MPSNYRADHVGSFLRPGELLEARGSADPVHLREVEDRETLRVLGVQKDQRILASNL
jgi:methionine synthase II (cobalamin-independent)